MRDFYILRITPLLSIQYSRIIWWVNISSAFYHIIMKFFVRIFLKTAFRANPSSGVFGTTPLWSRFRSLRFIFTGWKGNSSKVVASFTTLAAALWPLWLRTVTAELKISSELRDILNSFVFRSFVLWLASVNKYRGIPLLQLSVLVLPLVLGEETSIEWSISPLSIGCSKVFSTQLCF